MPARDSSFAVAVIADAHFHDIDADFDIPNRRTASGRRALRSWSETATAGRAFNESRAALAAALDKVRARGIRHVVLLGDYTDDGQIETTHRLAAFLQEQRDRHGLAFYAIPGNHDVFGPLGKHTATRLVTTPGQSILVTSDPDLAATETGAVLTRKMRCDGQPDGLLQMAEFGLFRQAEYLHWETPFGLSDNPELRTYLARSADGRTTRRLMDASYLVEPEDGLWLLMIDANVFEPSDGAWRLSQKRAFIDPSAAGWNAVLRVKPFLLIWIADVVARAKRSGKHLIAFSHYPAVDPFGDASDSETALFGETEVARRTPKAAVAQALTDAGLRTHVSGHVHANGVTTAAGLTNIAVPSVVAFPPGFKILRTQDGVLRSETVSLPDVPRDPDILSLYRAEGVPEAVIADDFGSFLAGQLRRRVIERILPTEWPPHIAAACRSATALTFAAFMSGQDGLSDPPDPVGLVALSELIKGYNITTDILAACPLTDLIAECYLLRQAGPLAADHLSPDRMRMCRFFADTYADARADPSTGMRAFFARLLSVLSLSLARAGDVQA